MNDQSPKPANPIAEIAPTQYAYDAFLSYRSATDYERARKIETFLESFHKSASTPSVSVRPLKICRDGSDFTLPRRKTQEPSSVPDKPTAADDPIWQIIQAELSKAQFLIVLCSPGALNSSYVSKEIQWFIANRGKEWIIPVVTDANDPKANPDQSFPAEIVNADLHRSLIWYDLRGMHRSNRGIGIKNYEDEIVRLAADLLSWDATTYGPLAAIWERQQSKRRRRQSLLILIAAVLLLATGGYALMSALQKGQALQKLEASLRDNQRLQETTQQAIDQRNSEVAAREHEANLKDEAQKREAIALAGEKIQAAKAIAAAKIAEERRKDADRQREVALARQLAAEAQAEGGNLLLATESLKRVDKLNAYSITSDKAIRKALELSPVPVKIDIKDLLDLSDNYVAAAVRDRSSILIKDLANHQSLFEKAFNAPITAAVFSPGELYLGIGTKTGDVYILNMTSKDLERIKAGPNAISHLTFSADSERLGVTDAQHGLSILNVHDHRTLWSHEFPKRFDKVAFSGDLTLVVAVYESNKVTLWNTLDGREVTFSRIEGYPFDLVISKDLSRIAVAAGKSAYVWKIDRPDDPKVLHTAEAIFRIAFSVPDGSCLTSVSGDRYIYQWDTDKAQIKSRTKYGPENESLHSNQINFSSDGAFVVINYRVWNVLAEKVAQKIPGGDMMAANISPSTQYIATKSSFNGEWAIWNIKLHHDVIRVRQDGELGAVTFNPLGTEIASGGVGDVIHVTNTSDGQTKYRSKVTGQVWKLAYSPDGYRLASIEEEVPTESSTVPPAYVILRDANTGTIINRLRHNASIRDLEFSSDGKTLATASEDRTAKIWDATSGARLWELPHNDVVVEISLDPREHRVVTASGNLITMWQLIRNGKAERKTIFESMGSVTRVEFNPNGKQLVIASYEHGRSLLRFLDVHTGKTLLTKRIISWFTLDSSINDAQQIRKVQYSHDGRYVSVEALHTQYSFVWQSNLVLDSETGDELVRENGPIELFSVTAFSSNDEFWVVQGLQTIDVWSINQRQKVSSIQGHGARSLVFSPDDKYIAWAESDDLRVVVWRPKDLLKEAYRYVTYNFPWDDWLEHIGNEPYARTSDSIPIHSSLFKYGRKLAETGNIRGATNLFKQALKIDPTLNFDPRQEALRYYRNQNKTEGLAP